MATISEALAIAIQHHQAGRLQAAEQIYRQILAVEPSHADAVHLLGVMASQRGEHELAVQHIARAIGLKGNVAAFHNNLGEACRALHRTAEAIACYRRALELKPDYADAHNNLGIALTDQEKLDEAIACFRRAVQLKPGYAEAHNNLGNALKDQGKPDEAIACYRRALELKPDYADAHVNLAIVLNARGKPHEAAACCRRALELKPDFVEAHDNLGAALQHRGEPDEAAACYRRALELKPDFAEAHNHLGTALYDLGKLDEAIDAYRRVLELKPHDAEPRNNLGNALRGQGKLPEAMACYDRAIELKPDFADAHWNRSLALLAAGDWQAGWPEYQWRRQTRDFIPRPFLQPLWNGEPLTGKTILLHAEQGLGDTIQFIRYAPLVKQRGATVVVACQEPLVRLLEGCAGIDQLVAHIEDIRAFDVHASLMSVPGILKTSLETIPAKVPYLIPRPELVEQWRTRLTDLDGLRVGITWQGNPAFRGDRFRSIPLGRFAPLAQIRGVRWISLQKGVGSQQLAEVRERFPVVDLGSRLQDFTDTAAVMKNLDLVITSDTAAAHLAGALGVPVWVALSFAADWRWLLDRSDSPWYPTMRLFRQRERGNWQAVFEAIEKALSERLVANPATHNQRRRSTH